MYRFVSKLLIVLLLIISPLYAKADTYDVHIDALNISDEYFIDIVWGKMSFTYQEEGSYIFNETTKEFDYASSSGWICSDNEINITNNSNHSVNVSMIYDSIAGFENIQGAFTNSNFALGSNESITTKLDLSGRLNPEYNDFVHIGTITIKLS